MREEDNVRLHHTFDAACQALGFVQGKRRSNLAGDQMLVLALVKAVEIIGEAATQIPDFARAEVPELPWADMVGMRHRLVHGYFDINLDVLWQTLEQDLPPLIVALEQSLKSDDADG